MPDPVEIKLTLDKEGVKRDLDRMKAKFAELQKTPWNEKNWHQSGLKGFSANLKPQNTGIGTGGGGGGGLGFGLERSAFPSGVGTGPRMSESELPKAAQKEIGKIIGKAIPKAVEKEVESILPKLLKSFAKGGFSGAAKFAAGEAVEAAGGAEGIASAIGGEGAASAVGGIGAAAGTVVTYAAVAALVAIAAKKALDQLASTADFGALVLAAISSKIPGASGIFEKFNEWSDELHEVKANLETLMSSAKRTIGLEESRLFLGGETQSAGDFSRIHDLQVRKQREEAASDRQVKNDTVRSLVRQLTEGAAK